MFEAAMHNVTGYTNQHQKSHKLHPPAFLCKCGCLFGFFSGLYEMCCSLNVSAIWWQNQFLCKHFNEKKYLLHC